MQDREKRTIAYGLRTGDPGSVNAPAPSFPPTGLKFQTYEYVAPNETKPEEGIGKGDNNMLLYLQMTDHESFPDVAILEYSGNYTSRDMDVTMCIGRDILWDKYLLRGLTPSTQPLLQIFNQYTYAWVDQVKGSNPVLTVDWKIGMGDPNHHSTDPKFYSWSRINSNDYKEWTWNPNENEQKFDHQWQDDGAFASMHITCE